MQAFTKIEIKWVIDELEAEMKQLKSLSAVETGAARSLYLLRARTTGRYLWQATCGYRSRRQAH